MDVQALDSLSIRFAAISDAAGLPSNEDACVALDTAGMSVLIVADGVGGHARGEVASDVVITAAKNYFAEGRGEGLSYPEMLREAFTEAQNALLAMISATPKARTMRSTLLIALATRKKLWIAHVGDSRAYLVRDGKAEQLTRDDTLVQGLVDIGQLDAKAAKTHSKANVLLQSVGDPQDLDIHVSDEIVVRDGDVLIGCSDGLSDVVDPELIAESVATGNSNEMARRLLDAALERNAPDNVSVGVIVWRKRQAKPSIAARRNEPKRARRKRTDPFQVVLLLTVIALAIAAAVGVYRRQQVPAEPVGSSQTP